MKLPNSLSQTQSALATPTGQKVLKWGAIGIGAIVAYFFIRKIKKNAKEAEETAEQESAINKQLDYLKQTIELQKSALTIDETTATGIAERLYQSMKGTGTNFGRILQEVREYIFSQVDWDLVTLKFGARTYDDLWSNKGKMTLGSWLAEELNDSQYSQLVTSLGNKNAQIKF